MIELVLAFGTAYLLFLTVGAVWVWLTRPGFRLHPNAESSAFCTPHSTFRTPQTRFALLVPAHDEELLITRTVDSLLAVDYPRDLYRVHVIADNCSDETAARARAAGATVHERSDPARRGK